MRLKLVEINGFKSFPDKVDIDFDEGVIAIVGPNGSGKSNVVDAVRWVLGEQSSKALRGGKMEDVIFTGTQHRKAVGMAEVSLVLDNADGTLPTPLREVRVTRRLYRSGESEYLLAGRPVRLKDVNELFMNTGVGRDGYSLIGQGKIAEVLSNRSEDRRAIFEEAAGISKYRYRRAESMRRLEATEGNLVRLRDILGGYAARVEPLRLQSEKARKYLDYREERKGLEINVWLERLEQTKDLISKSEDDYQIVTGQLEELAQAGRSLEEELEALAGKNQRLHVEMDEALRAQRELEQKAAAAQSDAAVTENEQRHNRERRAALTKSMELSEERREALRQKDAQAAMRERELEAQKRMLEEQLAALEQKVENGGLLEMERRMARLRMDRLELADALGQCRAQLAAAQTTQQAQCDNETKAKAELAAMQEAVQLARQRLLEAQQRQKEQKETLLRGENAIGGYEKKQQTRKERLEQAQQAEKEAQRQRSETEQRLRVLEDLEKNREGFSGAVKLVLQEAERGRLPGVHGALSSLIETKKETTLAIETALGPAMGHIVVETEQQAKAAISLLKSKNAGRATFLPLSAVQTWGADRLPRGDDGVVGVAAELVSCDERYRPLLSSLLGKTLVARDIDAAISLAKRHSYRFRIVTLDGQLVNAGGSLTGGSQARGTGILTRRREIEELLARLTDLREREKSAHEGVLAADEELRRVSAEREGALAELQTAREERIKSGGECESAQSALDLLLQNEAALLARSGQAQQAQAAALALLEQGREEEAALLARQSRTQQELAATERGHGEQAQRVEREVQAVGECRLALTALERDRQALADTRRETVETLSLQGADRAQLEEELFALQGQESDLLARTQRAKENARGLAQRRQELQDKVLQLTASREGLEGAQTALRARERETAGQRENLVKEQARCEVQRAQVEAERDAIVASLWDEYELTVSAAKELRTPMESKTAAQRRIAELKQIVKALGNVNVGAIEEYKEVKEQFEFYSAQVEDLETSERELEGLIADLTKEMQTIFSGQFAVINTHFDQTFRDLFGGGTATLSMADPSNVLESSIDMRVQPPGKIINNLSALSGGEQALTAIALYFAILKVRPSPFVILDEIDTALDEVNVVRLAGYYRRFTEKTQLILITHRRGAMEAADILYGITMQERGVSKLLKIDVNDVERQIKLRAT